MILKVVYHAHQSDGQSLAILAARIELLQVLVGETLEGVAAHLPLLVDDAALLVYLLVFQQQSAAPVFQYQETGVQGCLASGRHVTDAVDCLVDRSVGVQIAAKFHAEASGELDDSIAREVL